MLLTGARPVALLVDRVRGLVESPLLLGDEAPETTTASRLTLALCRAGEETLPLLALESVIALACDWEQNE